MGIVDRFERFAAAFEAAVEDDDWSRVGKHLAENATYLNVGGTDSKIEGREAIKAFLQADVSSTDRRFDTRTLIALAPPGVNGNRLSRRWRCIYTLAGVPDLVVEGEARYLFQGDLIKEIEEELTAVSKQKMQEWMQEYGDRLRA